jgi:hypothetical protein
MTARAAAQNIRQGRGNGSAQRRRPTARFPRIRPNAKLLATDCMGQGFRPDPHQDWRLFGRAPVVLVERLTKGPVGPSARSRCVLGSR